MQRVDYFMGEVDMKDLEDSFYDACRDIEFRKFILGLGIGEKTLMKYTSSLEDAHKECANCKKCKNLESCPNQEPGFVYTPEVEKGVINFSYIICPKMKEKMEKDSYKANLDLYEMPKDIENATFRDVYKDDKARLPIVKYFKEFIDNYENEDKPKGVYLTGSFGSGKTYLIAALFNEMARKGVKSVSVYYPEFLRSLKASFGGNYGERYEYIKKIPLLLLDDIGAENCTNWSRDEILGPLLQYRMDNHLPTFFTSNLSIKELESALAVTTSGVDKVKAKRIVERIKQLTITLELVSENRRD